MKSPTQTVERAIARFQALLQVSQELEEELAQTRAAFTTGAGAAGELGGRRHLEWFLFERPSEFLEGVPVEALQEPWFEEADPFERDVYEGLLASHASAFLVTSVDPGSGLVVRDLFGLSELAVIEPEASQAVDAGDLLVGRMYPVGGEGFLLSPAISCFRDASLVEALERDVERLRASRRGVLRIQQVELERMFFERISQADEAAPEPDPEAATLSTLESAGLPLGKAAEVVARVTAGSASTVVTDVLNDLAFHTGVDLGKARTALVELWAALVSSKRVESVGGARAGIEDEEGTLDEEATLQTADVRGDAHRDEREAALAADSPTRRSPLDLFQERRLNGRERKAEAERESRDAADRESVLAALQNFDEGRAKGRDLDELFGQLASDLQLEAELENVVESGLEAATPGAGDEAGAPDFPGVVGAMVAEFRWEAEQVRGLEQEPAGWRFLEAFAESTRAIGVFEDLTADALVAFAARDALDLGLLRKASDAADLVSALDGFATWCDEDQGLDLRAEFGPLRAGLAENLPRLAEARRVLAASFSAGGILYEVAIAGGTRLALRTVLGGGADDLEDEREVDVPEPLARHLKRGDLVRVQGPQSAGKVIGVHPPEARAALLQAR